MTKYRHLLIFSYLIALMALQGLYAQDAMQAGPANTRINYKGDAKMFPCKWRNNKIRPEFSLIPAEEIPRMQKILDVSLAKYPGKLLKKNLKGIYVLKTLFFFGLEYGGTYYRREVYLTNNGIENGYSDKFIEGTFHHEFSSVLIKRYIKHFDRHSWLNANPKDFAYGGGGVEALQNDATGLRLDSTLYHKGFLNEYSLASIEEDLNCYAEYIFLNDPGFWDAWESSEAIRTKTETLIRFYQQIDPIFTLEYFRGL